MMILKEHIPGGSSVLSVCLVLSIKSTADVKTNIKALYVLESRRKRLKDLMVQSTTKVQPQSMRLLLALRKIFRLDIWSSDDSQAYLHAASPINRDVFVRTAVPEFALTLEHCLMLFRPLDGLCDSRDLCDSKIDRHHLVDLQMKSSKLYPVLYFYAPNNNLEGLSAVNVDDFLRCGENEFARIASIPREKFDVDSDNFCQLLSLVVKLLRTVQITL